MKFFKSYQKLYSNFHPFLWLAKCFVNLSNVIRSKHFANFFLQRNREKFIKFRGKCSMRKENLQFLQKINRNPKNKLSFKISKK